MVSQGKAKHSELQNKVDILTAQHANEEKNPKNINTISQGRKDLVISKRIQSTNQKLKVSQPCIKKYVPDHNAS